jgi:hypothetical protein
MATIPTEQTRAPGWPDCDMCDQSAVILMSDILDIGGFPFQETAQGPVRAYCWEHYPGQKWIKSDLFGNEIRGIGEMP